MDALSVTSAVTGLLQATGKVIGFLGTMVDAPSTTRDILAEVQALQAIFRKLHVFISAPNEQSATRGSRIQLHDLVVTLTDCVTTFSELEVDLKELGAGANGVTLTTWERTKWAVEDKDISRILRHLQMHKASLGLMLSIYLWCVDHPAFPHRVRSKVARFCPSH